MQEEQENMADIFSGIVIEDVDLQEGQKNFSADVYMDVLRAWCKHLPANLEKLRFLAEDLTDSEKLREYTITVHGLKGSNYGICAGDLGKDAENLETASRSGDIEFIRANNGPLMERANRLYARLESFLAANTKKAEKGALVAAPDAALLAQLLEACKHFRSTAMEDTLKQLEAFEYESGGDLIPWLRDQMDNLEYDAIQERLADELK